MSRFPHALNTAGEMGGGAFVLCLAGGWRKMKFYDSEGMRDETKWFYFD